MITIYWPASRPRDLDTSYQQGRTYNVSAPAEVFWDDWFGDHQRHAVGLIVEIAGEVVPVRGSSIQLTDAIDERSTFDCVVVDDLGAFTFDKGQQIQVFDNEDIVFSGVLEKSEEKKLSPVGGKIHRISAVDNHYFADKRIVAQSYEDELAGDVIKDIISKYLDEEGITEGDIDDGPTLREAIFNYEPASDVIEAIAGRANYWWLIDHDKKLHFAARDKNIAPWTLTEQDVPFGNLTLKRGNTQYRNKQFVQGAKSVTAPQIEVFRGDGEARSFTVGFPLARVPTVEVSIDGGAWESQNVGIRGVEDAPWLWSKGSHTIKQDDDESALTSDDRVRIIYQGEIDIIAVVNKNNLIMSRKQVEGGSGKIEHVIQEPHLSTREVALEVASQKIQKYGVVGRRVRYRTQRKGLRPGQLQIANVPSQGLSNAELLIESIRLREQGAHTWFDVEAIEGPIEGSWTRLFYEMAKPDQAFKIHEGLSTEDILTLLRQYSKNWQETEQPNIFHEIYPGAYPGPSTYPMFAFLDRVKYLAWYENSTELGRKQVTIQEGAETNEVFSLTFLNGNEAVGTLTHFGWWGGINATNQIGTGFELDKQVFDEGEKNDLEAIQVEKTDTKDW